MSAESATSARANLYRLIDQVNEESQPLTITGQRGNAVLIGEAEVHLWAASDQSWKERGELARRPVCSGAESFIAGTASYRIEMDHVDALYAELVAAAVPHPGDPGSAVAALDLEGNLLTFHQRQR